MKLLFDCTELSYYNDSDGHRAGVFNVALNLLKEFQKQEVELTFYCDYRRIEFIRKIDEFKDIPLLKENNFINRLWAKLFYITRNFPIRLKYLLLILSRFYDAYFYIANKKNVQQLQSFDAYFSPYSPPSKEIELVDLKRFRMIHDTIPILENGYPRSPKDWYYKIYNSINGNDFYFANSENTRADIQKYFPCVLDEHIKTTLLGVNENFQPLQQQKEDKYIFSLCTLGKRKNIIFAIKNFFTFIEMYNIKDLKLVLGGGIWKKFEKELQLAIGDYDKSKLMFTGYVKDEDLSKYYSNALMFVYPSLYEGFGLPVLEAMKCGCPVITSKTSSLPEVIGNAGIQIDPRNNEELIEAYRRYYYDNFFRELCSERGKIHAKRFTWKKCSDEILEFIELKVFK